MEFWIFYDKATGVEISSGSGTPQMFAAQPVPEGTGIIKVPYDFALRMPRPLDLLRAEFEAKIDGEADAFAQRFITPGIRKALTYPRKEAAARAFLADESASTLFLAREATARGMSIRDLAAEVVALADQWAEIGDKIEAASQGAKAAIRAATTIGGIAEAGEVDWTQLLAADPLPA